MNNLNGATFFFFFFFLYSGVPRAGCVSAGEHFNPFRQTHGGLKSKVRHAGDLGNIVANAEGVAMVDLVARQMALSGPLSIIGRSIVVSGCMSVVQSHGGVSIIF